jgi:hypothetical protein
VGFLMNKVALGQQFRLPCPSSIFQYPIFIYSCHQNGSVGHLKVAVPTDHISPTSATEEKALGYGLEVKSVIHTTAVEHTKIPIHVVSSGLYLGLDGPKVELRSLFPTAPWVKVVELYVH